MGRYEIRKELGRGMMGVVYEAFDPLLHRAIALKTIHFARVLGGSEGEHFEKRFLAEARSAARLSHPGIVVVHDVGRDEESGVLFIALELLTGQTLEDRLGDDGFSDWREALRIAGRVAEALDHAHSHGVIHRDIKPANIMISSSGAPKIMDFGIARIDTSDLTSPGEIFGTPLYMAPEQALGQTVDARSDILSLGSVLYAMLTDRSPFFAPTVPAILAQVAYKDPTPPSELVRGLPENLDYVVARALAKDPKSRYARARALAEDINDVRSGHAPRHRAGYVPPPRGDKTLVSVRSAAEPRLETLEEEISEPPGREDEGERRSERRSSRFGLLAALCAVALVYALLHPEVVHFWKSHYDGLRGSFTPLSRFAPPAVAPAAGGFAPLAEGPTPAPEGPPSMAESSVPALGESPSEAESLVPVPGEPRSVAESSVPAPGEPRSVAESPVPVPGESPSLAESPAQLALSPVTDTVGPVPGARSSALMSSPSATPAVETPPAQRAPADADEGGDLEDIEAAPDPQGGTLPPEGVKALPPPPDEKPSLPKRGPKPVSQPASRAHLRIEFEHTIKDGWLRIWIDKKRVLTEKLESRTGKVHLRFRTRKDQVRDSLRLAPGRHGVYVEVTRNANRKKTASSLLLQLRPNENRALVVLLDGNDLRLSLY